MKYFVYKSLFYIVLRLPDCLWALLFKTAFPIYKALHQERAYGRVQKHLKATLQTITPDKVFRGIFWNALDSYRGLARFHSVTKRITFENEALIQKAVAQGPVAAISIHQGAFELLHRSLCRYSPNVHLITDSVGDQAFRQNLAHLRNHKNLTEYHPDKVGDLLRNLFKTRGILAMVVDQGRNTKGNTVNLFGRPTTLYLRLPEKVNQMGAGIITFRTFTDYSQPQKPIIIRFEKYYPPQYNNIKKDSDASLIESIAKEIETWIAEHPEQWSWNYHGNFRA